MKIKKTKINKKKKKEKQRKEEERTVMARYEGPVVEKSSRFKSRRRVNIYFLSMVEPNRSTSCNYMKENSGMKKWKQKKKKKKKKDEKTEKEKEWNEGKAEERGKRKIGERAKKEMTRKVPSTSQHWWRVRYREWFCCSINALGWS